MPSRADLAKIHIAKKELALDDLVYRDILREHGGAASASDLDAAGLARVLAHFRRLGWVPKSRVKEGREDTKKSDSFIRIQPGPYAKMQRKVLALWAELGYEPAKLHARVKKQFRVERFEWLKDYRALHTLITDLEARQG